MLVWPIFPILVPKLRTTPTWKGVVLALKFLTAVKNKTLKRMSSNICSVPQWCTFYLTEGTRCWSFIYKVRVVEFKNWRFSLLQYLHSICPLCQLKMSSLFNCQGMWSWLVSKWTPHNFFERKLHVKFSFQELWKLTLSKNIRSIWSIQVKFLIGISVLNQEIQAIVLFTEH